MFFDWHCKPRVRFAPRSDTIVQFFSLRGEAAAARNLTHI